MPNKDPVLEKLVIEQREGFNKDLPEAERIARHQRIVEYQKKIDVSRDKKEVLQL